MNQKRKYPNTGILFGANKNNPKGPDVTGSIDLDEALLRHCLANLSSGCATLRLAGWKKQGAKGPFLSLRADVPRETKPLDARLGEVLVEAQQREKDEGDIPW